jgi:hypothetical protein
MSTNERSGRGDEDLVEPTNVETDTARGTNRGSDAWGSEASGGSVIDKRSPDKGSPGKPSSDDRSADARSPEDWTRSQQE